MAQKSIPMPPDLREHFDHLYNEAVYLHIKWEDFAELFTHSKERIDLLNKTAPSFFLSCLKVFPDDFTTVVCRLTDPIQSGRKENLTLARLFTHLDPKLHPKLHDDLVNQFNHILTIVKPFRDRRNRRISHTDLPTALQYDVNPLPRIPKSTFQEVLILIEGFLNAFQRYFDDTTTAYSHIFRSGGANVLVRHLENSLKWREESHKRKLGLS